MTIEPTEDERAVEPVVVYVVFADGSGPSQESLVANLTNLGYRVDSQAVRPTISDEKTVLRELISALGSAEGRSPAAVLGIKSWSQSLRLAGGLLLDLPNLRIDVSRREIFVDDQRVGVSKSEFGILSLLASHPGHVFTRDDIVSGAKGADYPVTSRSIDVHVVSLRRKLGSQSWRLQTVRGVGYRFLTQPECDRDDAT